MLPIGYYMQYRVNVEFRHCCRSRLRYRLLCKRLHDNYRLLFATTSGLYRRTAGQSVCKRVRSTLLCDMHSRISANKCNYTNSHKHKSSIL